MTEFETALYTAGYDDCRGVVLHRLREVLASPACRPALEEMVKVLEQDQKDDHWRAIQKEIPDITKEEYQASLDASFQVIAGKFYGKDGALKARLVKKDG
jgi:hypothetical protein